MLYTRPSGAGSNVPTTAATPAAAQAAATADAERAVERLRRRPQVGAEPRQRRLGEHREVRAAGGGLAERVPHAPQVDVGFGADRDLAQGDTHAVTITRQP